MTTIGCFTQGILQWRGEIDTVSYPFTLDLPGNFYGNRKLVKNVIENYSAITTWQMEERIFKIPE